MKNVLKAFGIIALVAVIGFSMVTCDDWANDDSDDNSGNYNNGDYNSGGNNTGGNNTGGDNTGGNNTGGNNTGGNNTGGNNTGGNNNTITKPDTPTNFYVYKSSSNVTSSSIQMSWDDVTRATGYYVYRSSSASGTYTKVGTSTSTLYTNTGLSANTTYYYKVSAYNSAGESSMSAYDYATTSASSSGGGGGTTPTLGAPTGVTATRDSSTPTTVKISWNAVSGASKYKVYYSSTSSGTGSLDDTVTATSYNSTNNSADKTWYFRVIAVSISGTEGTPSSWVSVGPVTSGGGSGGGTNGSVKIVNNSTRTIMNFTLYQQGYDLIGGTGYYSFSATIQAGESATWTNAPSGNYVRIGSQTYSGYKVNKNTSFTVTAGQTTTVTITNSDIVSN